MCLPDGGSDGDWGRVEFTPVVVSVVKYINYVKSTNQNPGGFQIYSTGKTKTGISAGRNQNCEL